MRIAFLGTPEVAVPALRALAEADDVDVAVVITNPDRPRGRGRTPQPPPVKRVALELGLEVWQPTKPVEVADDLRALDLDVAAVVAYGALLPPAVLDSTRHGFVNLHFSLLPRWRGAAPVQHAIRVGDELTGVTTFVLDEGMDTGPLLDQVELPIGPDETAGRLLGRLAHQGAPVLVDSLRRLVDGAEPTPQPDAGGTLAPKVTPDDVRIDWARSADDIDRLTRSADPAPGAHTTWRGERLKVWRARVREHPTDAAPGTVVALDADGPIVATGAGTVALTELQPPGKSRMDGTSFVNGYQPEVGERLGAPPVRT